MSTNHPRTYLLLKTGFDLSYGQKNLNVCWRSKRAQFCSTFTGRNIFQHLHTLKNSLEKKTEKTLEVIHLCAYYHYHTKNAITSRTKFFL